MLTLGINFGSHDAAAALVDGSGLILYAAEEERFNRKKHSSDFPVMSIERCFKERGIRIDDIDKIALFVNPSLQARLGLVNAYYGFPKSLLFLPYAWDKFRKRSGLTQKILDVLGDRCRAKIEYFEHHRAHAASAFYPSSFDSAAVMTYDGRGEYETIAIFKGQDKVLTKLDHCVFPHSLGYLYSMITKYLGFVPQNDEYKIMGLAAYGSSRLCKDFSQIAWLQDGCNLRLNLRYFDHHFKYGSKRQGFSQEFVGLFGSPRMPNDQIKEIHADIAYALQKLTEEIILKLAGYAHKITNEKNLCLAGGVALNCLANQVIIERGPFDKVFIQPAADDSGTSIGAALVSVNSHCDASRNFLDNVYLGPLYSNQEIIEDVSAFGEKLCLLKKGDISSEVARLIYEGNVVGWFGGRMEFGPRALGNRSILASPLDSAMKELINSKVKFREEFRPFAPVVKIEDCDSVFDCHEAGQSVYPFMLSTVNVRKEFAGKIPAATHIDNTARLQTISRNQNPRLWQLIDDFGKLSGVPVLINTSFNIKGQPIVCTPKEAINSFLDSGIDYLVLEDFLFAKVVS